MAAHIWIGIVCIAAVYFIIFPIYIDLKLILNTAFKKRRKICIPNGVQGSQYVALGSSFAAGPKIGKKITNSIGFGQGEGSYPQLVREKLGISTDEFANATRSGALLSELPSTQLHFLTKNTRLVTLTAGGNDVHYTRDCILRCLRHQLRSPITRGLIKWFKLASSKEFTKLETTFDFVLKEIKRRSPNAVVLVITYINVLPSIGAMPPLTEEETQKLHSIALRLADITRKCASRANVPVIDMASLSTNHDAVSTDPWAVGFPPINILNDAIPLHPNEQGHRACAHEIVKYLQTHYSTLLQHLPA